MKIFGKYFLAVFLAVFILAVSGCFEQNMSPEDLKNKVLESSKGVKSYSFDSLTNAETQGIKFEIPMNGTFDFANKRLHVKTEANGGDVEVYVFENAAYVNSMGFWTKMATEDEIKGMWAQLNQYDENVKLLSDSKIQISGEEDIRGEKCYVVKLTPDKNKFFNRMTGQTNDSANEEMQNISDSIKNISATLWVSKKTYYITKSFMAMNMTIKQMDVEMDAYIGMTINLYDYNKPVSIQPPEEALNAKEFELPPMPPQIA